MIAHLLIIFNIFLPFSTCSIIDKAFLSLSWGGEAEVSVSLCMEREMREEMRRERNKRGKQGGKEIREGNEREKGNKRGKQEAKGKTK